MNFGRFFEWRFAMRKFPKILTGAAAAALVTLAAAAPAQAQWRDYDDDIDLGDIAAGIAIIGGAAIAIDALTDHDRYDRYGRYGRTYEIGRAPCREKVCQYGSIAVVAVPFKKQNIDITTLNH